MTASRVRLDRALVDRGLCASRTEAQTAIAAGLVLVGGSVATNAARQVASADALHLSAPPRRFVSRGGEKLDGALSDLGISCEGLVVLDAGASTGGFTDCLLQRGAAIVYAVDVGYGQFDHGLRGDPRVVVRERTNVRHLVPADLDEEGRPCDGVDLVVADLSFISLTNVAQAFARVLRPHGRFLVLVKPQFEAARADVRAGRGVVRDAAVWGRAIHRVVDAFVDVGLVADAVVVSSLRGPKGNVEFLLAGGRDATLRVDDDAVSAVLASVANERAGEVACED